MSSETNDRSLQIQEPETEHSDSPSPQMTYRNNFVTFKVNHAESAQYTMESCKFTISDFSITSGQDPNGKIQKGQVRTWYGNSEGKFEFVIGRKNNSSPANFWKNNFTKAESTFNDHPNELNFAFYGPLDMEVRAGGSNGTRKTYRIAKFGLGQGHAGSTNNWWVGCKGAYQKNNSRIACEGVPSDGTAKLYFTFRRGGNAVDVVDITNINPSPTR